MVKQGLLAALFIIFSLVACEAQSSADDTPEPTETQSVVDKPITSGDFVLPSAGNPPLIRASTCRYPSGWFAYRVSDPEATIFTIAPRYGISADELLAANCLTSATQITLGTTIYVPPLEERATSRTVLPISISQLDTDRTQVNPNEFVTVAWTTHGATTSIRLGWVYDNQFREIANNLPSAGNHVVQVPNDGRSTATLMLWIADNSRQLTALTILDVQCGQDWFFVPVPEGCPSPLLVTTFHEQRFERGTIVYIPALGVHYVMVVGQEAQLVQDTYRPGMALADSNPPNGYSATQGPIHYVWKNHQGALGYAIVDEIEYQGLLQRTMRSTGEVMYFSASSTHVYQVGTGMVWGVLIPR